MEAGWSRMNGKVYAQKDLTRIAIYDITLKDLIVLQTTQV